MKEKENLLEPLWEKAENYFKTNLELLKLKAIDKTSDIVSTLLPKIVFVCLVLIFALFLSVGIALWLGYILGYNFLGFFAVAAFYGVCGIIINFLLNDRIKEQIRNSIIKQLLK
jgi:hypothetical protein